MISVEEDQRDLEKLYTGFADLVTARLVKEEDPCRGIYMKKI